jgi:hypothetical protein
MSGGACGRILFTGEPPDVHEFGGGARVFLPDLDPSGVVGPPFHSRHTFGDAVVTLRVAREHGFRTVLLVTSPYHTRRAAWVFSRVLEGTGIRFGVYPSAAFYMEYDRWWSTGHGRWAVLGEHVKLWLWGLASTSILSHAAAAAGPS